MPHRCGLIHVRGPLPVGKITATEGTHTHTLQISRSWYISRKTGRGFLETRDAGHIKSFSPVSKTLTCGHSSLWTFMEDFAVWWSNTSQHVFSLFNLKTLRRLGNICILQLQIHGCKVDVSVAVLWLDSEWTPADVRGAPGSAALALWDSDWGRSDQAGEERPGTRGTTHCPPPDVSHMCKKKGKSATSCSFHNKSPSYYPTTDFEIIRRLITKQFRSSLVFDFTSSNFVFLIIPHQLQENVLEKGSKFS